MDKSVILFLNLSKIYSISEGFHGEDLLHILLENYTIAPIDYGGQI